MKKPLIFRRVKSTWKVMHIADKCLCIIMTILLIQTAHNLLFHELAMQESNALDIVIRTTAAAIFGYFISSNFHTGYKSIVKAEFDVERETYEPKPEKHNRIQIVIIAFIGIASLVLLLIARNYVSMNVESIATLSQLRDFISGSVGFLIGQSTSSKVSE